jgi:hypothetical protein
MDDLDLSDMSEITILPDGRVYAFGITRQVTEVLESLRSRPAAIPDCDNAAPAELRTHQQTESN